MYRSQKEITVQGRDLPKPISRFEEANLPSKVYDNTIHLLFIDCNAFSRVKVTAS